MKTAYGDHLTLTTDGHVATIVIDRPANNHVSVDLMRDLADALEAMDRDNNIRAVVLAAAGRAFCAGADLVSPTGIGGTGMSGIDSLYEQAVRLFAVETPIVAAVQGAAVGAGLGLALVADFRVVAFFVVVAFLAGAFLLRSSGWSSWRLPSSPAPPIPRLETPRLRALRSTSRSPPQPAYGDAAKPAWPRPAYRPRPSPARRTPRSGSAGTAISSAAT